MRPDRKATGLRAQRLRYAARSLQPESRAAREDQGVDIADGFIWCQKVRLPRAGRAAHHVDPGGEGCCCRQNRDTGFETCVARIADKQAVDICDQVAGAGLHHWALISYALILADWRGSAKPIGHRSCLV